MPFSGKISEKCITATVADLALKNVPKSIQKCAIENLKIKSKKLKTAFFACVIAMAGDLKNCIDGGFRMAQR